MTDDNDTALAVRGAMWCGWRWYAHGGSWDDAQGEGVTSNMRHPGDLTGLRHASALLLVALLAKCRNEGIVYRLSTLGGAPQAAVMARGSSYYSERAPSDLLALLRALDAAGLLPEGE